MGVDLNLMLGLLLVGFGIGDIVIARVLADRLALTPSVRKVLTVGGLALVTFGALLSTAVITLI